MAVEIESSGWVIYADTRSNDIPCSLNPNVFQGSQLQPVAPDQEYSPDFCFVLTSSPICLALERNINISYIA